jgi:hypothetical protein
MNIIQLQAQTEANLIFIVQFHASKSCLKKKLLSKFWHISDDATPACFFRADVYTLTQSTAGWPLFQVSVALFENLHRNTLVSFIGGIHAQYTKFGREYGQFKKVMLTEPN